MDINNSSSIYKIKILATFFLIISFMLIPIIAKSRTDDQFSNRNPDGNPQISSSSNKLVDKVYNFTTDKDYVNFSNNIPFLKPYIYYISFEIVTPHSCHMNISLWDSDNDKYDIYDSRPDGFLLGQFDEKEIPFGVSLTGNYTITFKAHLTENLNIHIKIINSGVQCLQEAISPEAFNHKEFYQVNKFKFGGEKQHNVSLKSDYLYRFYFGRYSPIAHEWKSNTTIDFNITSSIDIEYKIYVNDSLPGALKLQYFDFGTTVEGAYIFNISIYCKVLSVNIAYAIVEIEKIADGINPNDPSDPIPDPIPDNNTVPDNNTISGVEAFMPKEWTIGIIIATGIMVGVPILIVVNRKKKNATGI
ncbi:MAG: hypothetical protein KAT57_08265 [Candidatus Lokiarchaeota archaeon]|nr:hypothetical protein [Candidatus Lokiarchaeota archaeon]